MPEHVHLLVYPLSDTGDIEDYLGALKQPFSKEIKALLVESKSPLLKKTHSARAAGKDLLSVLARRAGVRPESIYTSRDPSVARLHSQQPGETRLMSAGN